MTNKQVQTLKVALDLDKNGKSSTAVEKYIMLGKSGLTWAFYSAAIKYEFGNGDMGQNSELALKYYKLALESDRKAEAMHSIARIYSMEGDFDKAFEYYTKLSKLENPLSQVGHYRLGVLYYSEGLATSSDLEKAIYHLHNSAKMGNIWALRGLAEIESKNGNKIRAILLNLKALALNVKYVCVDPTNPGFRAL